MPPSRCSPGASSRCCPPPRRRRTSTRFWTRPRDYVAAYERDFVGVVAEETYRQDVRGGRIGTDLRGFPIDGPSQQRELKSDVLLVRAPDGDRWMQFRDVFEVDGKPVRDRADRLTKLFLQPSGRWSKQIQDIATESARYNIGGVNRNDQPAGARADGPRRPQPRPGSRSGQPQKDSAAGPCAKLEYREERGGTLIRTTGDESMPVARPLLRRRGNRTGAVERAPAPRTPALKAQIDVTYGMEPSLGMLVPREMREKYTTKNGSIIEGKATYAKFRRYQVTVDEKIK